MEFIELFSESKYFVIESKDLPVSPNFFVLISILFSLVFFAWIINNYRTHVRKIFAASLNEKVKSSIEREDSETIKKVGVYLNILYFISLGLLFYALDYRYQIVGSNSFFNYVIANILIALFFILKYGVHYFLGWVFDTKLLTFNYLNDSYYKFKVFGVLAIPMILFILFSNDLFHFVSFLCVLIFALLWLLKCYKGLLYSYQFKRFPIFYAILYICTLEILPLLLIGNVLITPLHKFILNL